jgi:hypothetical protein
MTVKTKQRLCIKKVYYQAGSIIDLDEKLANDLIKVGQVEQYTPPPVDEEKPTIIKKFTSSGDKS